VPASGAVRLPGGRRAPRVQGRSATGWKKHAVRVKALFVWIPCVGRTRDSMTQQGEAAGSENRSVRGLAGSRESHIPLRPPFLLSPRSPTSRPSPEQRAHSVQPGLSYLVELPVSVGSCASPRGAVWRANPPSRQQLCSGSHHVPSLVLHAKIRARCLLLPKIQRKHVEVLHYQCAQHDERQYILV
jgi:hypothetical protein